ncbi:hypothetical protein MNB_SUP05-5-817 [hydrothermal vent metagenome]|uniref:Uncharacterized protein n=1 Tax=hydrothermal vent metagenome TaxID=652676 RepID=A0A1W1BER8_9ZZZZ
MKTNNNYIALADILANGVAIMLILIVISISINQQQQKNELEKVSEIGSVMSREISSSVIMSNLPSSGPAKLHNYNHKRYPNAPLIQLYDSYLFIKDNGNHNKPLNWKIPKNELLIKNNRFDNFLTSLNKQQRLRIRIDVVSIKLFYLIMSIVKEHKISIRHWHFDDKYQKTTSKPTKNSLKNLNIKENLNDTTNIKGQLFSGESKGNKQTKEKIPVGSEFAKVDPFNIPKEVVFSGNGNKYGNERTKTKPSILDSMSDLFAKSRGISKKRNSQKFIESLEFSFGDNKTKKLKNSEKSKSKSNKEKQQSKKKSLFIDPNKKPIEKQLIDLLLNYLNKIQLDYDNHLFVDPNLKDFKNNAKQTNPKIYQDDFDKIYKAVFNTNTPSSFITTTLVINKTNQLVIKLNQPVNKLILNAQQQKDFIDNNNQFSFLLYNEPTINIAKTIKLKSSDILLLPYYKQLNKINLGFVYGVLNKNNLKLNSSENNLKINNIQLKHYYQSNYKTYQKIKILFIILLSFLILFLLLRGRK